MEFKYGAYDANKASAIDAPDGHSMLAFHTNVNPFKPYQMGCFRNESNKVVISLIDNSTLYTADEWQALSSSSALQQAHEKKMDELLDQAVDALNYFLEQE